MELLLGRYYGELQAGLDAMVAAFAASLSAMRHIRMVIILGGPQSLPDQRLDVKKLNWRAFPINCLARRCVGRFVGQLLQPDTARKGIITDLDNTLWAGILGDAEVEGVAWDLQGTVRHNTAYTSNAAEPGRLRRVGRGGKQNDPEPVHAALARRDMLLRADAVYPVEAHWKPKSAWVARILRPGTSLPTQ